MRKMPRVIALVLSWAIVFSTALPTHALNYQPIVISDPYVHAIGNDLLTAYVDYDNGRFLIASKTGDPTTPLDNYQLFLAESGVPYIDGFGQLGTASGPESSFTTIQIDGVAYIFGNDYSATVPDSQAAVCKKISDTVHETVWQVNGVEVTQRLQVPADYLDKYAGMVTVSYAVKNNANKQVSFGSRMLLDTSIVHADNAVIFMADDHGEKEVRTETAIAKADMPSYWRAQTNYLGHFDLDAVGLLEAEGIEPPDRMVVGHWKGLSSTMWDYLPMPGLDFTVDNNPFGTADSAVALYWESKSLPAGGSFTFSTGYGLGLDLVSKNPAKPESWLCPAEVELTDDQLGYKNFDLRVMLENSWVSEIKNVKVGLYFDEEEVFAPAKIVEAGTGREVNTRTISWDRIGKGEKKWATLNIKVQQVFRTFQIEDFEIIVMYDDPDSGQQKYNLYSFRIGLPAITRVPEVKYAGIGPEYFYYQQLQSFYIQGSGFDFLGERDSLDPVKVTIVNTEDPADTVGVKFTALRSDNVIWCYLGGADFRGFQEEQEYRVTVSTKRFGSYIFPKTLKASSQEKYMNHDYGLVTVYREPGSLEYKIRSFDTETQLQEFRNQLADAYYDDFYTKNTTYDPKDADDFMPLVLRGSAYGNDESGYRFPDGTVINDSVIYRTEDDTETGGMRLYKAASESGSYVYLGGDGQIDVGGNIFVDGRFQIRVNDGANYSLHYELPVGEDPSDEIDWGDNFDLVEKAAANPVMIEQTQSFMDILQFVGGFPVVVNDLMLRPDGVSLSGSLGLFLPSNILPNAEAPPGESNKSLIKRMLTDSRGSLGGGINVYDIRYARVKKEMPRPDGTTQSYYATEYIGMKTDASVTWPKNIIPLVEFGGNARLMLNTIAGAESVGISGDLSFTVLRAKGLLDVRLISGQYPVPNSLGFEISGKVPVPIIPPIIAIIRGGGYIHDVSFVVDSLLGQNVLPPTWGSLIGGIADETGNLISGDPLEITIKPLYGVTASGTLNLLGLTLGEATAKVEWDIMHNGLAGKATIEGKTSILDVLSGALQVYAGVNLVNKDNPIYPLEIGGKGKVSGSILGINLANAYLGVTNSYCYARGNLLGMDVGVKYYWKDGKVSTMGLAGAPEAVGDTSDGYVVKDDDGQGIVIDNFSQLSSSQTKPGRSALLVAGRGLLATTAATLHEFTIAQQTDALLKVLYTGNTPTITVTAPNGSVIGLVKGTNYLLTEDGEQKMAYVSLPNAAVGAWRLSADSPVDYELIGVTSLPQIKSIAVKKQLDNTVTLMYSTDRGAGTTLKYYLAESQEQVGSLIGQTVLTADGGTVDLELPAGMNGGSYYLRAEMIDREANLGETYAEDQVIVHNPKTPAAPLVVTAENAGNNQIRVSWNSDDALTDGYFVELCDQSGESLTGGAVPVARTGAAEQVLLGSTWTNSSDQTVGLAPGQAVKIAVTAYHEVTVATEEGTSQTATYTSPATYSDVLTFAAANPPTISHLVSNDGSALVPAEVAGMSGFLTNQSAITVTGSADQPVQVLIYANKELMASAPGGSAQKTIALNEGNNELVVKAVNAGGDSTEEVIYVLLDSTPPALMIKSPVSGGIQETDTILVEGAAELGSMVTVNGLPVATDMDGLFSTAIPFGSKQTAIVTIEATDTAGNSSQSEIEVGRAIDQELMLAYIDTDADTLELGQPVQLKLYGVYEDNSVLEMDNGSVIWSVAQGNGAATVDEAGVLTLYDYSTVYVTADYLVTSDYAIQDVKAFLPGTISHDQVRYTPPSKPADDDGEQEPETEPADQVARTEFTAADIAQAMADTNSAREVSLSVSLTDGQAQVSLAAQGIALLVKAGKGLSVQFGSINVQLPLELLAAYDTSNGAALSISVAETPSGAGAGLDEGDELLLAVDISTNFSGNTGLRLPAPPGVDPTGLRIRVEHSDGTVEQITPTVVIGEDGRTYLEINVDRFSRFIIYQPADTQPVAETTIRLTVGSTEAFINGQAHQLGVAPRITAGGGRTLVPIRFISETLGADVTWVSKTRQVHIVHGSVDIWLTLGSNRALVNGQVVIIDAPALVESGRTFVPLRFVSETLGATVQYQSTTKTIIITR